MGGSRGVASPTANTITSLNHLAHHVHRRLREYTKRACSAKPFSEDPQGRTRAISQLDGEVTSDPLWIRQLRRTSLFTQQVAGRAGCPQRAARSICLTVNGGLGAARPTSMFSTAAYRMVTSGNSKTGVG